MVQQQDVLLCADALREILLPESRLTQLASGLRFTEGPVWLAGDASLLFSDIPADRLYRWSPAEGLQVWREPSRHANGNTLDREGRLLTCEHGARQLTRTEPDGRETVLAASYQGRRLNSPNDVIVKSDNTIWFTDPHYGIRPEAREQPHNYVFRLDPGATEPVPVADDFVMPNGLCFSPDESRLYLADSSDRHHIRVFTVTAENTLVGGEVFAVITPGVPDGMRVDAQGRLFTTAADGVHVYQPDGTLLGKILVPEVAANCAFGGDDRRTLFITATHSLYAVPLATAGAREGGPRDQ